MIKSTFKRILYFFILLVGISVGEIQAAHIVGGDVTYSFVRFNGDSTLVTFNVITTLYRDATGGGADFDRPPDTMFGVFRRNAQGTWIFVENILNIGPMQILQIPPNDLTCVEVPSDEIIVEEGFYEFEVTLEVGDTDYMIAYQRCCRNESIFNIFDPGDTGASFDVIITPEAQMTGNNSPTFNEFPPIFICAGFPIDESQAASDVDGDDLRYSFCAPFSAGGTFDANSGGNDGCCSCVRPFPSICPPPFSNVRFVPPFSPSNPLGGDPQVTIDNLTGLITGIPDVIGQFVVGVCVEEFRNGVKIGEIRRDFQFNVLECEAAVFARLDADEVIPDPNAVVSATSGNNDIFVFNRCGETELDITNLSTELRFIDFYDWELVDSVGNIIFTEEGAAARDVSVDFPDFGVYNGRMILNEGLFCSDTAPIIVNLFPGVASDFVFAFDTCVAGPTTFTDMSTTIDSRLTNWDWTFDDAGTSTQQNPMFMFPTPGNQDVGLRITDNNGCQDSMNLNVAYFPAPEEIIVEPSSFVGCNPVDVFLNNLSFPIDSTYDIFWDLGDGNTSTDLSPTNTYLEPGIFSVSVDIVSPIGCEASRGFPNLIRVLESPIADFTCDPMEANNFDRTVNFTDLSTNAQGWQWDFGGVGSSFVQNPTFEFPDTGIYRVLLTSFHPVTNCPDTISKLLDVVPSVEINFPNAFTPNNDSSNDLFLGVGFFGVVNYQMSIYNRWGQLVFETTNPREGWNGMEFNSGPQAPQGVYVYKVTYDEPRGDRINQDGHLTLLR